MTSVKLLKAARVAKYPGYALAKAAVGTFSHLRRAQARSRPKILVYTDSRGFRVDRWYCRKNPYLSYAWDLADAYHVTDCICPFPHTTLVDFLYDVTVGPLQNRLQDFDAIVLHVGIVDFSPRPVSGALELREMKAWKARAVFGRDVLRDLAGVRYAERYGGEATESMYPIDLLATTLLAAIEKLPCPVIWIAPNRVVDGWRGTYFRDRPANMNVILEYSRLVVGRLPHTIALDWTDDEVQTFTVDNVHLSASGFRYLFERVAAKLSECGS